jgi:uncharacterized protein (DUF1684 family)
VLFGEFVGSEKSRLSLRIDRRVACTAAIIAALCACTSGPSAPDEDPRGYVKEVEDARAEKDRVYGADAQTIPAQKRAVFLPLKYYPVDPAFKVPAALRLSKDRPVFDMPTSTGTNRKMQRVGVLEFTLHGSQMSLAAFVEDGTQQITSLFVPFADATTGTETYSAGRYLDLKPTATGFYVIDFNRAYNPTCAYNPTWECPYPPAENRLKVAIRAGEKAPPEAAAAKASGA